MAELKLLTTTPAAELRSRFVFAAKSFVNAPYRHRGRSREMGFDCYGIVRASALTCGMGAPDYTYGLIPEGDLLDRMLSAHMVRLPHWTMALPGDVITRRYRLNEPAKHCGIVTTNLPGNLRCVHASRRARRVTEVCWTDPLYNSHAYRAREIAALEDQWK